MSSEILSVRGGKKRYIVKDKVLFFQNDVELRYKKNPANLYKIFEGPSLDELLKLPDIEFIKLVKSTSGVGGMCTHLFKDLHESLVELFLRIIDDWKEKYPEKIDEINYKENSASEYPPNYTDDMIRLKSISFDIGEERWTSDNIKGYCPFEPQVRIAQLLTFPIERFADIDITFGEIGNPPTVENLTYKKSNNQELELKNKILACLEILKEWDKYYKNVCNTLHDTIESIDKLIN